MDHYGLGSGILRQMFWTGVHEDGYPVLCFQFQAIFKHCLSEVGVRACEFHMNSFNICIATEASRPGLSNADVQRIGRWRSSCFAGYVRLELLD